MGVVSCLFYTSNSFYYLFSLTNELYQLVMHYVLGSKSTTKNLHKIAKLSQLVEDSRKKNDKISNFLIIYSVSQRKVFDSFLALI